MKHLCSGRQKTDNVVKVSRLFFKVNHVIYMYMYVLTLQHYKRTGVVLLPFSKEKDGQGHLVVIILVCDLILCR